MRDFVKALLPSKMDEFVEYLIVQKVISKSTADTRRRIMTKVIKDLKHFLLFEDEVFKYVSRMYKNGSSKSHIRNTILALESYMSFIGRDFHMSRPKKETPRPEEALSESEISIIIHTCKNVREKALVALFAYSGIRVNELSNLKVNDLDLHNNSVTVFGKGSKWRSAYITPECSMLLQRYLNQYQRSDSDYLFTTLRKGNKMDDFSIRKMIMRIAKKSGMNKRVHPHLFRHSLAVNMIARGASILAVKEQLGHEFIETTMIYVKIKSRRVQSEYNMYSPSYL